ncbi:MarR family winged helix-turn-helix transcriptional regulator [Frigoribacterium sp. 2-23]|uniref:MarR family winged helix-turn-helix transcriptional regulator n=1 Tax=Frigoribacterium sp. 2-23 TaxID=3415006 RepID=UPI003C705C60
MTPLSADPSTASSEASESRVDDAPGAVSPLAAPGDDGREGLMASVVDEIGTMLVQAKRTIADAASRFDDDVAPAAFFVLRYVSKHGPCTSGDIVKAMSSDKSSVSRHVTALREAGFVHVDADQADGRVLRLTTTPKAEQRILELRHENRAMFRSHVDDWTDAELTEFRDWLSRFNAPLA